VPAPMRRSSSRGHGGRCSNRRKCSLQTRLSNKIAVLKQRAYGFHSVVALIAMIFLIGVNYFCRSATITFAGRSGVECYGLVSSR
jgi:hypothetical protein